jgi:hypothetical protein
MLFEADHIKESRKTVEEQDQTQFYLYMSTNLAMNQPTLAF